MQRQQPEMKSMKRTITLFLLMIACVFVANAQTRKGYQNAKVERELKELVRQWDSAMVNRDITTLERILADEFTLSGTPKTQFLAFVKSPHTMIESAVSDNFDVRVYNDTAVLIARDTIKSKENGVPVVNVYRYIDVWIKRAGRWQCVVTESYLAKKP
jgi:ketosteroid isomerase-like protein